MALNNLRNYWRQFQLRCEMAKLRTKIIYWNCRMRITKARLEFWRFLYGCTGTVTPEKSEQLTGIEVSESEE